MKTRIGKRLNNWYMPLITGLLFILVSAFVFTMPITSFLTLILLIGIGFIIAGTSEIIYSLASRKYTGSWKWDLTGGAITLLLGILLASKPGISTWMLSLYIGGWVFLKSIALILTSLNIRKSDAGNRGRGWGLILGALGIVIALVLLFNPKTTTIVVSYWMGAGLLVLGTLQISLAFSLRRIRNKVLQIKEKHNRFDEYELVE